MLHVFRLPEPGSPEISVDHSQLSGLRVSVGGERLPRLRERGRPAWNIPMTDGTTRRVSFGGQMTGLQAIVADGPTIQLERRLAVWELILAALPFGLIGLTGLAGGVVGLLAVVADLRILRMSWPLPLRVLATIGVFALAFVVSYVITRALFA
jgi:hypothetical protein